MVINNPALTVAFPDESAMLTNADFPNEINLGIFWALDTDAASTFFNMIPNWFNHEAVTDSINTNIWKIFWLWMVKKQKVIQAQFS